MGGRVIYISCFGGLRVETAQGEPVAVGNRKNQAILAILAVAPQHSRPREAICDLLWPDKAEAQARGALRQSLTVLRRELAACGEAVLLATDAEIALNPALVSCDVRRFLALSASRQAADLAAAWALYAGPFFEAAQVGSAAFQTWHATYRQRFHALATDVLHGLCEVAPAAERLGLARKLVEFDPIREASHRLLIAAYLAAGESALAARQYEACLAILKSEFGVEPSPETQALKRELLRPPPGRPAGESRAQPVAQPEPASGQLSLAVLPFRNLTAGAERQYLADGLTEDITSDLARFRSLFVLGSGTSYHSAKSGQGGLAVARELGVRFFVEGSIRQTGHALRVAVRLTETLTGREIWAHRYDVAEEQFQATYDNVVGSIVATLEGRMASAVVTSSRRRPAPSYRAYERVLRARELLSSYRSREAEAELLAATASDESYAQAHAWLALARWSQFNADVDETALQRAVMDGARAVALDPEDSVCHAHYALALMFDRQFGLADVHAARAVALNPGDLTALTVRADCLARTGQGEDALALLERALKRDPYPPGYFWESLAIAQMSCGRHAEALTSIAHMHRRMWWDEGYRAICHAALGDAAQAAAAVARLRAERPQLTVASMMRTEPHSSPAVTAQWAGLLRQAGLPG